MKKLISVLLFISLLLSFCGCSNPTVPSSRNENLSNYTVSDVDDVIVE